ncbi:hypothetical protein THAOC_25655, partial [Thalassiosira oceanica]
LLDDRQRVAQHPAHRPVIRLPRVLAVRPRDPAVDRVAGGPDDVLLGAHGRVPLASRAAAGRRRRRAGPEAPPVEGAGTRRAPDRRHVVVRHVRAADGAPGEVGVVLARDDLPLVVVPVEERGPLQGRATEEEPAGALGHARSSAGAETSYDGGSANPRPAALRLGH